MAILRGVFGGFCRWTNVDSFVVLDNTLTAIAFLSIATLASDVLMGFCTLLVAMAHSLWAYHTGVRAALRRENGSIVSESMRMDIESMKPGTALRYKLIHVKQEFVVIEADDYEHILTLANLKAIPIKKRQENGNENRSSS